MKYEKGTKFVVCTHDELKARGWTQPDSDSSYEHVDSQGIITHNMIEENKGKTLTVRIISRWGKFFEPQYKTEFEWYKVDENVFEWPVSNFLEQISNLCLICIEGMTPIDGWFICKNCGDNLREIK